MSSAPLPSPTLGPRAARAIDTAAAQWAVRRRTGLDCAGEAELAAWLAADPAHAEALGRMTAMAEAVQRARASGTGDAIVTQLKVRERQRRSRRRAGAAAGLAAALVLGASLWWHARPFASRAEPARLVESAETIRRLPDGSIVELNGSVRMAVKFEDARRLVELFEGEALFRVEKDEARPFLVRAAGVEVRAVGTAFCVKLAGAAVEVLVTEGRVGVDDAVRGRSLLPSAGNETAPVLAAGQRVTVERAPETDAPPVVQVTRVEAPEMKQRLAWRIPRLEFDGAELALAVEQLNRVNRVQISLEGAGTGRLRISGTFRPDDPRTFARLAATSLGLELEVRGEGEFVLREVSAARNP